MFLALGVAALILLAGTDLSIGRMVGMGMTAATIIMHQGINTGGVFGHIFDFTGMPLIARVILALVVCVVLCTFFTTIAGFFTAKFKMHPFIFDYVQYACDLWSCNLRHKGCYPSEPSSRRSEYDHPEDRHLPDHHFMGGGSHCDCVVHLE